IRAHVEPLTLLGCRGFRLVVDRVRHDLGLGAPREMVVGAPFLEREGGTPACEDLGVERLDQRQRLEARDGRVGPARWRLRARRGERSGARDRQRRQRAARLAQSAAAFGASTKREIHLLRFLTASRYIASNSAGGKLWVEGRATSASPHALTRGNLSMWPS